MLWPAGFKNIFRVKLQVLQVHLQVKTFFKISDIDRYFKRQRPVY